MKKVTVIDIMRSNVPQPKRLHRFCQVDVQIPFDILYIPIDASKINQLRVPETPYYVIHLNPYPADVSNPFKFDLTLPRKRKQTDERELYYNESLQFIKEFKERHRHAQLILLNSCEAEGCYKEPDEKTITTNLVLDEQEYLECRHWFQRALVKLTECSKGRLVQKTGTCYLTAVVNGILIQKDIRNLCIRAMNRDFKIDPDMKKEISKSGISDLVKLPQSYTAKMFLYKILYHTFCKQNEGKALVKGVNDNLFKLASGRFFSYYNNEKDKRTYGESGFSVVPLCNMFNETSLPGFLLYKKDIYNFPYIKPFEEEKDFDALLSSFIPFSKSMDEGIVCVQFYEAGEPCREKIAIRERMFKIAFVILGVRTPTIGKKESFSHQVLGFFCEGVPMIYDSHSNDYYFVNWLNLNDPNEWAKLKNVFYYINKATQLANFFYDCGVYVQDGVVVPKEVC